MNILQSNPIMKRKLISIASLALFGFACQAQEPTETVNNLADTTQAEVVDTTAKEVITETVKKTKDTISIIGVGDMMLGTNYPSASYLPPNDGKDILGPLKPTLQDADLTFGNLEGVLLNAGGQVKHCNNPNACYAFRMPEHYGGYLKDAGFDVVSLANNHMGDFGATGRNTTMKTLDNLGIQYAGQISCPYDTFTIDGIKYGLYAVSPNYGTISIHDYAKAKKTVAMLDTLCDVVIVSFHGGAEGNSKQRVPKKSETFYGENRGNVHLFAHTVIDAGADIVFGHGPHVTRAMELYKDRFIIYSMGNFCTYGRFSLSSHAGVAPVIKVNVDKEGKFLSGEIIPIYQGGLGGPKIDPQKRAIKELISLTNLDYPNTPLTIGADGKISRK